MADSDKVVHLCSSEGEAFDVPLSTAVMSELVKTMIDEDADADEAQEIPLPNVKTHILVRVVDFMRRYSTEPMTEIEKVSAVFY
jgi:S-phase kinase-associated protein 1